MQVYKELHILTARPGPQDEALVPHALYGVLPAGEACSAARWLQLACLAIRSTWNEGRLPIVTGGTGMYLKTLMEGLSPIPEVPLEVRDEAERLYAEEGAEALKSRDPEMALRLKAGDTQRHTRALSVWIATGKSLLHWQGIPREMKLPQAQFTQEIMQIDRTELYRRCDMRFIMMLEAGAVEEVKTLKNLNLPTSLPAMRAVGVPELMDYLNGKLTLAEATSAAQQATRNYAKRQLTWFRNQL